MKPRKKLLSNSSSNDIYSESLPLSEDDATMDVSMSPPSNESSLSKRTVTSHIIICNYLAFIDLKLIDKDNLLCRVLVTHELFAMMPLILFFAIYSYYNGK